MKSKSFFLKQLFTTGFVLLLTTQPIYSFASEKQEKIKSAVGIYETISVLPENMHLQAKVDTGAKDSSLDAQNIEFFTRDDKEWVRFQVTRALQKRIFIIERPLEGISQIKSRADESTTKESYKRPLIKLPVCLGDEIKEIDVNLTDRSHFKYPFLLGSTAIISFNKIVDPATNSLLPLTCGIKKEAQGK